MEQVRSEGPGESDREQREALEQVQMELRQARATLARVEGGVAIAETELEEAIDAAKRRRDDAKAKLTSLEAEAKRLRAEAHELDRQLEARKNEEALLAHGAEMRAKYPVGTEPIEVPPWVLWAILLGIPLFYLLMWAVLAEGR